jgi:hypothetical protein
MNARTENWQSASQLSRATSPVLSERLPRKHIKPPGFDVVAELSVPHRRIIFGEPLAETCELLLGQPPHSTADLLDRGHTKNSTPTQIVPQLPIQPNVVTAPRRSALTFVRTSRVL